MMKRLILSLILGLFLAGVAGAGTVAPAFRHLTAASNSGAWDAFNANDPAGTTLSAPTIDPFVFGPATDGPEDPNGGTVQSVMVMPPQVPEPASLLLLGAGLFGVGLKLRRKG